MFPSTVGGSSAGFRRITVVDDSPELLSLFRDLFDDAELTTLGHGARFEDLERSRPELLVVDLRLGTDRLPGWELVRLARAHPDLGRIPVIVCSGALDQMHDRGAAELGLPHTYLLPKPFSLSDLESVLVQAARARSADPSATEVQGDDPIPSFGVDPFGWFERIGREITRSTWLERCRRLEPAAWSGPDGHAWRVVRTARGVEVRPELTSPFLRFGDQPIVTALGLGAEVELELTTSGGRWVDRFPRDTFDVGALGRAMLEERRLPHDNLPRLFPPERTPGGHPDASSTAFRIDPAAGSARVVA
ncbi:MAG TPA: hypothetical protein VHQ42_05605 [Candidatus Limnocylindria bacterium]|nr:hypothetical protein [Candidatus Limnocylindria bacterium]